MTKFEKKMFAGLALSLALAMVGFVAVSYSVEKVWDSYQAEVAAEKSTFMELCRADEKKYKCEVLWKGSR